MVRDEQGTKRWKKVKVKLENHVHVPIFHAALESYDDNFEDYISKIAMDQLPQNQPLWDCHLINYPTSKAAGNIVLRLHHALGDGYSLMVTVFSCLQRPDDPSLPLTFPSFTRGKPEPLENGLGHCPCVSILSDNHCRVNYLVEDDTTPIRSGGVGVEFQPITISSVTFSLDDIRMIKAKHGGTVNDVIFGIIFYGIQLYMEAIAQGTLKPAQVTALLLLNTRAIGNYQTPSEMARPGSKAPWGNHFGFLHISLPKCQHVEKVDPIFFLTKSQKIIKDKKSSLAVYLTDVMLETLRKLKGEEAAAQCMHRTLKKTSMTISNMIGPFEKMKFKDNPIRSFHFMTIGLPQSLTITVVSYTGKLKVTMGVEKDFINSKHLVSCMEKSFERIFELSSCSQESLSTRD